MPKPNPDFNIYTDVSLTGWGITNEELPSRERQPVAYPSFSMLVYRFVCPNYVPKLMKIILEKISLIQS